MAEQRINDRLFRALVEHGTDCLSLIGFDEKVSYASPALLRSLGYEWHEMVGRSANDFLHQEDVANVDEIRRSPDGNTTFGVVRLRHKDGSWRWHEGTVRNLLADPDIRAYVCNRRDVTERMRLEEQLRQSQKMEAIGLLAGGVAHDFNNLLGGILGFAEMAARQLPADSPVRGHLNEVMDGARRGAELTRKLLAFSRKQILRPRPLDVHRSVEDFVRLLQRIVGEDVELVVEAPSTLVVAQVDAIQLEQVLLNLGTNARQAMPQGGTLRLATRAVEFDLDFVQRHPWSRPGSFAEIVVSDSGTGMDDATRARIFEPFFTTKPEGTGLGLATVYGIVQQHGGFLHVESRPGAGTSFHVFLPKVASPAVTSMRPSATIESPMSRGRELILLAEDEPSLRALVSATLKELGYDVICTSDGEEAVREFQRRADDIALVLLDVVMPRLGAREAYERMRVIRSDVKVLFTTGHAPESTRLAQLLSTEPLPILQKPFTMHALSTSVRLAIDDEDGSPSVGTLG